MTHPRRPDGPMESWICAYTPVGQATSEWGVVEALVLPTGNAATGPRGTSASEEALGAGLVLSMGRA